MGRNSCCGKRLDVARPSSCLKSWQSASVACLMPRAAARLGGTLCGALRKQAGAVSPAEGAAVLTRYCNSSRMGHQDSSRKRRFKRQQES